MNRIDIFVSRAGALAKHDEQRSLFGAQMHDWRHTPTDAAEFEKAHGVVLPDVLRQWIAGYGLGAGPFYGLTELEPPRDGMLVLTEHGCGYSDFLQLQTGEVWTDDGEELRKWFDSVEDWLSAWLDYAEAEWIACYLQDGVEDDVAPDFLLRCLAAAQRVVDGVGSPLLDAYPLVHLKLWMGLAHGALCHEDIAGAKHCLARAQALASPADAIDALAKILLAKVEGNAAAGLAAAEAGLASDILNWNVEGKLLREKQIALSALDRTEEHDAMFGLLADHYRNDLHHQYDHAWILLSNGDADGAADRLLVAANNGVGCEKDDPLVKRLRQVAGGLEKALKQAGHVERAAALHAAITRKLN